MIDNVSDARPASERRGVLARLLREPWVYAVLCFVAASWWVVRGEAIDLVPMVLALIAGGCVASSVLGFVQRPQHPALGWTVHVLIVVVLGTVIVLMIEFDVLTPLFAAAPRWMVGALGFLLFAALPCAGMLALALLWRIGQLAMSSSSARTTAAASESAAVLAQRQRWRRDRDGYALTVRAAGWSKRASLTVIVIASVIGVGVYLPAVFALDDAGFRGVGFLVLLAPIFILPLALASSWLARRASDVTIRLDTDSIALVRGGRVERVPLAEVVEFVWQRTGWNARAEVRSADRTLEVLVGLGSSDGWTKPRTTELLTRLPDSFERALAASGLLEQPRRRADAPLRYRRVAAR
ncbi:hypothetical protein KXS11_07400 [Plantibacter flavus]|uniref:hypothetical protein n=1 Tax=Plantibacter flavus TaxID=150123 RepID=UPI003F17504A